MSKNRVSTEIEQALITALDAYMESTYDFGDHQFELKIDGEFVLGGTRFFMPTVLRTASSRAWVREFLAAYEEKEAAAAERIEALVDAIPEGGLPAEEFAALVAKGS